MNLSALETMSADLTQGYWESADYQLVDFGRGRKLEKFGDCLLDRPCPAAERAHPHDPTAWRQAHVRLGNKKLGNKSEGNKSEGNKSEGNKGSIVRGRAPEPWRVVFRERLFELRLTPFGHVGLFPEQAPNWCWLDRLVRFRTSQALPTRALNLFAYTGGSTFALAAAGAQVTHVDASAPSVKWARTNAELSNLQALPVRWIIEDARKFVRREIQRGKQYDVIVLDPPSFGHGPNGKRWEIGQHLTPLIAQCAELLSRQLPALVLTAHCECPDMFAIANDMEASLPHLRTESARLVLRDLAARELDAGFVIRAMDASLAACDH